MLRDKCNADELEAHRVLDMVKAGMYVPMHQIRRALFILGDSVGLRHG